MLPKTFSLPKEKTKKEFPKFLKILIIFLVIFAGLFYLFFYSGIFVVQNIVVDETLPSESKAILEELKGQNIFFISSQNAEEKITNQFPEIQQIKIQRGLPDTLKIGGGEHFPKIVWQTQERSFLVDEAGLIFKEIQGPTDLAIVKDNKDLAVNMGSQVVSPNFLDFIIDLNNKFSKIIGFKLLRFEINDTIFQVNGLTDQDWFIKFDTTRAVDDQLEALSKLLASHKDEIREYADVRVEGKVYYK